MEIGRLRIELARIKMEQNTSRPLKKSQATHYSQAPTSQNGLQANFFVVERGASAPEIKLF